MGFTVAERDFYNDIRQINKKMKDQSKIDWEERRYEIVKEMVIKSANFPDAEVRGEFYRNSERSIQEFIELANGVIDALIMENIKHPLK